jgi:HTH-type transcriptional regulator/antitoxin HipB
MTLETANRLYELRKKNNLSQEELAEKLGVSRQAVSKWERSEASPDTDNLIALAKIYGLSLDELVYGEKAKQDSKNQTEPEEAGDEMDEDKAFLNIKDGDATVKIGPDGIFINEKDGDKVRITWSGIKLESSNCDDDEDDGDCDEDDYIYVDVDPDEFAKNPPPPETVWVAEDGKIKIKINNKTKIKVNNPVKKSRFWLQIPYAIICVIAYLVFGFYNLFGGWALSWIVFITIPIYYSFVEAIYDRKFAEFAYPVLAAFVYLYMGLYLNNWHPSWLVFLTIPIYYPIAHALDKMIKRKK